MEDLEEPQLEDFYGFGRQGLNQLDQRETLTVLAVSFPITTRRRIGNL